LGGQTADGKEVLAESPEAAERRAAEVIGAPGAGELDAWIETDLSNFLTATKMRPA
jgi:hypothetical protein